MPEENVEIVRRMYDAYLRGDAEGALAHLHPEVKTDFTVRADIRGVKTGREAMREIVTTWVNTWDDYTETIDELFELGDRVCLVATQTGRGKGSGALIENQFAALYEVEDGLITSVTMFMNRADALNAAGAPE